MKKFNSRTKQFLSFLFIACTLSIAVATLANTIIIVENKTVDPVGNALIATANGNGTLYVGGLGNYQINLNSEATSITINDQTVAYPNTGTVTLTTGRQIKIGWQGQSVVVVTDPGSIQTPVRN